MNSKSAAYHDGLHATSEGVPPNFLARIPLTKAVTCCPAVSAARSVQIVAAWLLVVR